VGAQNAQNWTASIVIGIKPKSAQNGGSRASPCTRSVTRPHGLMLMSLSGRPPGRF
jgi:hypothetical protein